MEDIPLTSSSSSSTDAMVAPDPTRYKHIMALAIERTVRLLPCCDWDLVSDEDDIQLCVNEEERGIRLVGRVRGSLSYWRGVWLDRMTLVYESYVCREEQTQLTVFAHVLSVLGGARYRAAGVYHVHDVESERTTRIVYTTDAGIHALHPQNDGDEAARMVDGTLGVWLREVGGGGGDDDDDKCCEIHLVVWPDFHMSTFEVLRRCGVWCTEMVALGRELKAAIIALQSRRDT